MKTIEITSSEAEYIAAELDDMIREHEDGKVPRSQFGINVMRSLLAKLKAE